MKVVLEKNSVFLEYNIYNMNSFNFKPKRNINRLNIVDEDMIRVILKKKIKKNINKTKKTIELMLESNATIQSDCDIMIKELTRLLNLIEIKYKKYFNEFEYFDLVNDIYKLNMEINLKKNLLNEE